MTTSDTSTDASKPSWSTNDREPSRALSYAGAGLAILVALLHLFHPTHGMIELFDTVLTDWRLLRFDPRPAAFVASGTALLVGVALSRNAPSRRPYYLAGMLLCLVYFVGFFAWHFTGHGGFLPGREPLLHGLSPMENVVAHLTGDLWAAASKAAEAALFVVLGLLYVRS
jgi:hypothetical protein